MHKMGCDADMINFYRPAVSCREKIKAFYIQFFQVPRHGTAVANGLMPLPVGVQLLCHEPKFISVTSRSLLSVLEYGTC